MKILIVEDNPSKKDLLVELLASSFSCEHQAVPNISGAYAVLEHNKWDLVILDMTFQVTQGIGHVTQKEALAGIELLQYMAAKEIKFPVIVATQHDDFRHGGLEIASIEQLHRVLLEAFPDTYRATVRVDLSNSRWHEEFLLVAKRVLNAQ